MKKSFLFVICVFINTMLIAQNSIKEDFEANSLEWTEYTSGNYFAQISKGSLKVSSNRTGYSGMSESAVVAQIIESLFVPPVPSHSNRISESHCFAPIDVQKPFTIRTLLKPTVQLSNSNSVGIMFNYRDAANFYCIALNQNGVRFSRYESGKLVGFEECPMIPKKMNNVMMSWELKKDGDFLLFSIEGTEFLKIRYAPIEYRGFGFFAYDGASVLVDEVEFIQ